MTRGLSDFIGERYRAELNEDLLALVGAVRGDEQGRLVLSMPPSDPRYLRPLSGWYWQIGFSGVPILSSPSLAGAELGEAVLRAVLAAPGSTAARSAASPTG